MKSLGQIAYEAYVNHSGGKSLISGEHLPNWDGQRDDIKQAWEAAGKAAASFTIEEFSTKPSGRLLMELSDVRIGDDGTAKVSSDRVILHAGDPDERQDVDVMYTFEEMLFADST